MPLTENEVLFKFHQFIRNIYFMSLVLRLLYKILIHRKNLIRIYNKDIFTLLLVSEDVLGPTVDLG